MDNNRIDPLFPEAGKHLLMVGPLHGIPAQSSHVLLLAIPVKVENHTVEGISPAFQATDNAVGLMLGLIAVFRRDISQRP